MYITQPIDATAQLLQKQTTSYILASQLLQLQHSKHVVSQPLLPLIFNKITIEYLV